VTYSRVTFTFTFNFSNGTQLDAVFVTSLVVVEIEQALGWYLREETTQLNRVGAGGLSA